MRGRAVEGVLNHLGQTSRRESEPRKMGIDDSDIDTGNSVACVMTLGVVAGCVAGGGKELGGGEGGLIGRAGDGLRLVVGKAGAAEGVGSGLGGLRLLLFGRFAVWHVMVEWCRCRGRGRGWG